MFLGHQVIKVNVYPTTLAGRKNVARQVATYLSDELSYGDKVDMLTCKISIPSTSRNPGQFDYWKNYP